MKALLYILFLNLFLSTATQAQIKIAFLEQYNQNGELVQYEPGGRFVHTAVQFPEIAPLWLNAYPREGVALIDWETLSTRGVIAKVIETPHTMTLSQIQPYWGKPFDYKYSWSDEAIYCTELIGKVLGIAPTPMKLNKKFWPPSYWHIEGLPGISPDGLYHWAMENSTPAKY